MDAGAADSNAADAPPLDGICPKATAGVTDLGDPVQICSQLWGTRPFLRPPVDRTATASDVVLYAAANFLNLTNVQIVDRTGKAYVVIGADGAPISIDSNAQDLPAGLEMPSHRLMNRIYRVEGAVTNTTLSDGTMAPGIAIRHAAPFALLTGDAIAQSAVGSWEATVSTRNADGTYDDTSRAAIRITFTSTMTLPNASVWDDTTKLLADGWRSAAVGKIDNFSQNTRLSDGSCAASLVSIGTQNPFDPTGDPSVSLYVYPGMHTPSDVVEVLSYPGLANTLSTGMGGDFLYPTYLLGSAAESAYVYPHGTPNHFYFANLHPVAGGGGGC